MQESDFFSKVNEFFVVLQKKSDYQNLDIEMNIQGQKSISEPKLTILDNSSMGLAKSNSAVSELSKFIREEFAKSGVDNDIVVDIKFRAKKVMNSMSEAKAQTSSNQKELEHTSMFVPEDPKYKLEDVVLSDETMDNIERAISAIQNFDVVYNLWNFKSKEPSAKANIIFWGAPGTGKTMCAHAIADYLNKKILIASYADIQSQYVGVGPKNLREVFVQAEENNALLFFDEADSFLRKRTSDTSNSASMHYNSMTNEMMKHLEDFNGVVIFATNLTENTDEAFKTRISYSVEFKSPDESCRAKIIKGMIPSEVPLEVPFSDDDYLDMAKASEGFVGRDIRNAIKSILSVGAQKKEYPFKKSQFVEGFKSYQENKDGFDNGMGKKNNAGLNPMDIYSANGSIHTLLSYFAWIDGPETEKETESLKMFSKILSRTKLVVNKLSDLPDLEEICQEIKEFELKKKALVYLAYFFVDSEQKEDSYSFVNKVADLLKVDESVKDCIAKYCNTAKEGAMILSNIHDN